MTIQEEIQANQGSGDQFFFVIFDAGNLVLFTLLTTIEGVQYAQDHNYMDHATYLAPLDSIPAEGGPYTPTQFQDDDFGRQISGRRNDTQDLYTITDPNTFDAFTLAFDSGTSLVDVYIAINSSFLPPVLVGATAISITRLAANIFYLKISIVNSFGIELGYSLKFDHLPDAAEAQPFVDQLIQIADNPIPSALNEPIPIVETE